MANRPKATNPIASTVSRNLPDGCARSVCNAPFRPFLCGSKVTVAYVSKPPTPAMETPLAMYPIWPRPVTPWRANVDIDEVAISSRKDLFTPLTTWVTPTLIMSTPAPTTITRPAGRLSTPDVASCCCSELDVPEPSAILAALTPSCLLYTSDAADD